MRAPLRFPPKRQKSAVGAGQRALKIFCENSLECTASKIRQGRDGRENGVFTYLSKYLSALFSQKLLADVNSVSYI